MAALSPLPNAYSHLRDDEHRLGIATIGNIVDGAAFIARQLNPDGSTED